MLRNIHVKNFALIDEVEIDLYKGFNVLTGETGAGKSIIIDAVNFALGHRVSKDVVREDTDYALSELTFSIDNDSIIEKLKSYDIPYEDGEIIFSRKIASGKSVARVNGETVPAATLKILAADLLDIHGQHDNQSLLSKASQHKLLDSFLEDKLDSKLAKLKECYVNYKASLAELENIDISESDKQLSYLTYQINEIDGASLSEGEDEELERLYKKMSSAKKIAESVTLAHRLTGYEDNGAGAGVGRALSQIRMISDLDDEAKELETVLTDIDSILNDFNRMVADYESSLDFSDSEFYEVENRLNVINSLKSKYGNSVESILINRDRIASEIDKLNNIDEYRLNLEKKVGELKKELLVYCEEISDIRMMGAKDISSQIVNALKDLNFLDSQFEIRVTKDEDNITSSGYDDVELFVCTNPGEKLKPLAQVASGGEMSRIMLAIKSVMAKKDEIPTLIFDEIDTGISGRAAQKVSEKIGQISRNHQVIVVTHLPQIAAMADNHYEIKKETVDNRTVTSIKCLKDTEIIEELARMLGGVSITDAVIENARDMKIQANNNKLEF
ncbi:MAG: DNA repair protein RecN [Lachnospiraceae bacterium]|nr:DNA repair protein RecN [Lachnospiraceae bacterium]